MKRNQFNNLPVAEIIECNVMGQQTIMEIDGRLKFLRIGDKLYTQPSQVAQPEQTVEPVTIEIDFKQATALLEMFGGEPTSITLMLGDEHSGNGLYAHYTFLPEEGALYLGEADEDALPDAAIAQPEQTTPRGTDAQILKEREITTSAIVGAMAYGFQNGEYPPDDSVWLRQFWEMGRRDAEREELIAQPEQPSAQKSRTESEIVALAYTLSDSRYCSNRIGKVAFNYDQLQAFVTAIAQPKQTTPVRQPLTHTEIVEIYDESMSDWVFERYNPYVKFARAIEVAHGIEQPKDKP